MAKNKQYYFDEGHYGFLVGWPLPTGSSWQQLAQAEGWITAQQEALEHAKITNAATLASAKDDLSLQKKQDSQNAIRSHIGILRKKASSLQFIGTSRMDRYKRKIAKLEKKYS